MTDDGFAAWHAANCRTIVDGQCFWESDEHMLWTAGILNAQAREVAPDAEAIDNARIVDQMAAHPGESPHPPLDDTWMYRQEVEARRRMGGPTDAEIEASLHVPVLDDEGNVLYPGKETP